MLTRSLKAIIAINLRAIVRVISMPMHKPNPILKFKESTGLAILRGGSSENSFLTSASKPYLMGDIYYIQVIQPGYESTFVKSPPNMTIGSMIKGAIVTAVSISLNKLESK